MNRIFKLQRVGTMVVLGAAFAYAQDSRAGQKQMEAGPEQKQWEMARSLPESVQLAEIEENLALLEAHQGNYRAAAQIMGDVISIEARTLGVDDPRIAQSLAAYTEYFAKLNPKAQAHQAQERRREIRRTTF